MTDQPVFNPFQLLLVPLYLLALPIMALTSILGNIAPGGASYSNEESWEVKRGGDGRITGITIHRLAKGS